MLTAGTRLGTYEIVGSLGAGGMGEVYRARDTKLHREVAIKILPEPFATDPDRLGRFEREAQGTFEVYVRPFPGPGPKHQISGDQSFDVHAWSSDGTKLFYRSGDGRRMMSVPVRTARAEFEFGKPSVLFELDPEQYPDMQFWGTLAAAPDGSGFAMVKRVERDQSARTHLMLMLDWR